MAEWKKGISKAGKIRTKAFSAVVTAIYPSQIKTGTGLLQLDFEDGSSVGIFGIDKAKITDDGVEVGGSLADFQESLEKLGYECQWGTEGTEILGFQTVPDIIGSKISIEPLEEQTVGDDTQTKKNTFWGIVTKVEAAKSSSQKQPAAPSAKPGKLPAKPKTASASPKADPGAIAKRILDEGVEDQSIGDLYTHFKKEYKPGELRDALTIIQG
jgi:hypothetical protein